MAKKIRSLEAMATAALAVEGRKAGSAIFEVLFVIFSFFLLYLSSPFSS